MNRTTKRTIDEPTAFSEWFERERIAFGGRTRAQFLEAFERGRQSERARLADVLALIAAPMRADGTWNRDREACRQIAAAFLMANVQAKDDSGAETQK
jgi:hypothetical protein